MNSKVKNLNRQKGENEREISHEKKKMKEISLETNCIRLGATLSVMVVTDLLSLTFKALE